MRIEDCNFEYQYIKSLQEILERGEKKETRTGIDTIGIQHQYFYLKNVANDFPIIKAKKVFPKMPLKELFWFMNGFHDVKWLEDRGVKYWKHWANENGSIGKSYGWQFRNFNGIDNFSKLIHNIIQDPLGRRHILSLWNPEDLIATTLPPCVFLYHFVCIPKPDNNKILYLDLHVTQRSADSFLGVPYDIMMDAWFNIIMAILLNNIAINNNLPYVFITRDVHHTCNDYHLYENHIDAVNLYFKNYWENKNNVVNQKAKFRMDFGFNFNGLTDFLLKSDEKRYTNFSIKKSYEDVYEQIKADVAI